MNNPTIVLASTSVYRRELLSRLQIPFEVASPDVDETPLPHESPVDTAVRLAETKARKVAPHYPGALIIGSDQVAVLGSHQIGKPLTHDNAVKQLRALRGRQAVFHTAIALYDSRKDTLQRRLVPTTLRFRDLTDAQIENYLLKEQPYHCAGSAKAEGLGIALIAEIDGADPNALIGLPLIALVDMLKHAGVEII
ncbi:MAG: Maf family nucleotide pyrophosphatase [Burkholderiales bacterium]